MSEPLKLLFICSHNRWRSRTAEEIFRGFPGHEARSAGTEPGARVRVTAGHLGWADRIFVMEKKHSTYLCEKFSEALAGKPVVCLNIPDDYRFGDAELVALLKSTLSGHVEVP